MPFLFDRVSSFSPRWQWQADHFERTTYNSKTSELCDYPFLDPPPHPPQLCFLRHKTSTLYTRGVPNILPWLLAKKKQQEKGTREQTHRAEKNNRLFDEWWRCSVGSRIPSMRPSVSLCYIAAWCCHIASHRVTTIFLLCYFLRRRWLVRQRFVLGE